MKIRTQQIPITDCTKLVDLERPVKGVATLPSGAQVNAELHRDGGHVRYIGADGKQILIVKHFDYDPFTYLDLENQDTEDRD